LSGGTSRQDTWTDAFYPSRYPTWRYLGQKVRTTDNDRPARWKNVVGTQDLRFITTTIEWCREHGAGGLLSFFAARGAADGESHSVWQRSFRSVPLEDEESLSQP